METLLDFNLSTSYNKVLKTKDDIAATHHIWRHGIRIDIQEQKGIIKTCQDFADVFSKIILKESQGFLKVRVLFDRY